VLGGVMLFLFIPLPGNRPKPDLFILPINGRRVVRAANARMIPMFSAPLFLTGLFIRYRSIGKMITFVPLPIRKPHKTSKNTCLCKRKQTAYHRFLHPNLHPNKKNPL
jgi:hypothetical protein